MRGVLGSLHIFCRRLHHKPRCNDSMPILPLPHYRSVHAQQFQHPIFSSLAKHGHRFGHCCVQCAFLLFDYSASMLIGFKLLGICCICIHIYIPHPEGQHIQPLQGTKIEFIPLLLQGRAFNRNQFIYGRCNVLENIAREPT